MHVADDLKEVDGDLTVRFTPNRPTQRLVFRLWPNGPLQRREGSQLDVGDATSAGQTLPATRPDPTTLVLRAPLRAGQSITVRLPWHLRVPLGAPARLPGRPEPSCVCPHVASASSSHGSRAWSFPTSE